MNKIIYLIIAILIVGGIVMFQNKDNKTTPNSSQSTSVNYSENQTIAQNSEYYRKYLETNLDNFYVVQDFYSGFDTKLTDPFILTKAENLTRLPSTAITDSGYYHSLGVYNTLRLWTKEGSPIEELHFTDGKRDGTARAWYPNGRQRYSRYYKGNVPDGLWQEWYENGQLRSEGVYTNNIQTGPWRSWFEDGSLASDNFYNSNGSREGTSTTYNSAKVKVEEGEYFQGKKQGIWHFANQTGDRTWQGEYVDDTPVGKWQWFYEGRLINEGEYKNGLKEGVWTEYDGNDNKTKETVFSNGQQVSVKQFEQVTEDQAE